MRAIDAAVDGVRFEAEMTGKGAFRVDVPVGQERKSAVVSGVGYDAAITWATFGTIT